MRVDADPVSSHTATRGPAGGQIAQKRRPFTRPRQGILETTGQTPSTLRKPRNALHQILHQGNLRRMAAVEQDTPVRDVIAAFSTAMRRELTARSWRKRSGEIYTLEISDGMFAWLGLNRSSTSRPVRVHPVAGVRHEATMQLCDDLSGLPRSTTPTLSEPIRTLGGEEARDLELVNVSDVPQAVERLVELVEQYGLPFAEEYRDPDTALTALRDRRHLAVVDDG